MMSAQALEASYGLVASSGMSSVYGSLGWVPYALSLEATTTRSIVLLLRHDSSTVQVPRMFESKVETGARLAGPTIAWAARWKQVSISYSLMARSISAGSVISPW